MYPSGVQLAQGETENQLVSRGFYIYSGKQVTISLVG